MDFQEAFRKDSPSPLTVKKLELKSPVILASLHRPSL